MLLTKTVVCNVACLLNQLSCFEKLMLVVGLILSSPKALKSHGISAVGTDRINKLN